MVMTEETQQKKARFKRVSPESQVGPGGSETTGNRVVKGENQEAGSSSRSRGGAGGFETRFESMERPVSPFYRNILQNYYSSPGED